MSRTTFWMRVEPLPHEFGGFNLYSGIGSWAVLLEYVYHQIHTYDTSPKRIRVGRDPR